jgi:hypothetical protein
MTKRKSPINLVQCKRFIKKYRYRDALNAFDKSLDELITTSNSSQAAEVGRELKKLTSLLESNFKRSYVVRAGDSRAPSVPIACSWCGKAQDEVRTLIAGPTVYICDECIDLCNDIIAEECADDETDKGEEELTPDNGRECALCRRLRRLDNVVYIPSLNQYFCASCVEAHVAANERDKNH